MYDEMNYAELDKMRDALLVEASGLADRDEGKLRIIRELTDEMDSREAVARRRVLSAVACINILVLATILFMSGCETFRGMKADVHWLTADVEHNEK